MISTQQHKSWQQRMLIGMMLVNILVLAALVWRIHSNQAQQQTTINSVLKDYAAMAGQRLVSSIKGQIGYGSMYQLSQMWASSADPTPVIIEYLNRADSDSEANQLLVKKALTHVQVINLEQQTAQAINHPQLTSTTTPIPIVETGNNYGFKALHQQQPTDLSYRILLKINPQFAVVAGYNDALVRQTLEQVYQSQPLLPSVLTPTQQNQGLAFQMLSPSGLILWQSQADIATKNSHTITIDDDYGTLFEGYQMTAAIDENLAASLIIGGLPKSQLPQLLLMSGLGLFAMITMLWLYRRSHQLNQQKEQFIARASHELKTPLTQIRLFAETLELGRIKDDTKQQHYLKVIHQESIRLSHLVDNILQQQQIQQNQTNVLVENLHIKTFLDDLLSHQHILWQQKIIQVEVHAKDDLHVQTDPNLMKQILINVLDNAVKFGPMQQTITIDAAKSSTFMVLKITDQGPGIPQQQVKLMLQTYQRLERDEHRGINGNGLGLSIANNLCQQLGGQLSFQHPPIGLTVVIELPCDTSKAQGGHA